MQIDTINVSFAILLLTIYIRFSVGRKTNFLKPKKICQRGRAFTRPKEYIVISM